MNWEYPFPPELPLHVFPYTVQGNSDKLHWHKYFEIGLCVANRGRFIYMEKVFDIGVGDVFLSNNNENHVAVANEGETVDFLFLIFMPSFITGSHSRPLDNRYLAMFNYNALSFCNKLDAATPAARRISERMRQAHLIYAQKAPFYELALDIKVREILLELACVYEQNSKINPLDRMHSAVRQMAEYVKEHYKEKITLNEMAALVGMSASHLRHLFQSNMQLSLKSYVTMLRLAEARKLLLGTDMGIHEIIAETGYTNVAQFYKIFRQYSHMTPAQYRKSAAYEDDTAVVQGQAAL